MTTIIAGLDEVGYGAIAGPVVVAVAAFPAMSLRIPGVRDSKKIFNRAERIRLYETILSRAIWFGLGYASPKYVDEKGLRAAWDAAALMALQDCSCVIDRLIVDGEFTVPIPRDSFLSRLVPIQAAIPKADRDHWEVSAASILAKEARDRAMEDAHPFYPQYNWLSNMGYGTKQHMEAIEQFGPSPWHRLSYGKGKHNQKKRARKKAAQRRMLETSKFCPSDMLR